MEIRAMDMQKSANAEEEDNLPSSQSKETENDTLTQDGSSASQQSLHQYCDDSVPAQTNSDQERLNEGEDAADDALIESTKNEERLVEGEVSVQVEQESDSGINEGECAADDVSAKSFQKEEGLAEGNDPDPFKQDPDVDCKEGEDAAKNASMGPTQQEDEYLDGEALRQAEQEVVVTMDEGDTMQKEQEGTASDEIEQDPVIEFIEGKSSVVDASTNTLQEEGGEAQAGNEPDAGLHEAECAADDASMDTLQKEEGLAEGEGQAGNELDVGLYEGEFAADDASMVPMQGEVPIQNELEPEVGVNEGECAADDTSMDVIQDEVPVQNEVEPEVGVNESQLAADEAFMNIKHKEEGVGAYTAAALDPCGGEKSIAINSSTSGESSSEEEPQERCEDVSSSMAIESQEHLQDDGVAVVKDESRQEDNHVCDTAEGEVDPLSSELPALKELTERDYLRFELNEPPTISMVGESVLIKEPSLCTPAMEALIDAGDQPLDGDEKHEELAGNDGFSNPEVIRHLKTSENGKSSEEMPSSDADWEVLKACDIELGEEVPSGDEQDGMGKELLDIYKLEQGGICRELLDISNQDVDEPVEETVEMADVKQLESVPPPGNDSEEELGLEAHVIQQAREADGEVAVPLSSLVQENGFLQHSEANMKEQHHTISANVQPAQEPKVREIGRSLVAPQQEEKDSEGVKQQKYGGYANGNATMMMRRTTWWGCCGMLDLFLRKG